MAQEPAPDPARAAVAAPRAPVPDLAPQTARILAAQMGAGNAAIARALARQAAPGATPAATADPALPPAHVLSETEPRILGIAGGTVRLMVGGRETAVPLQEFAERWTPGGALAAGSNYWYRMAWQQIVSGSGIPVKWGEVAKDKGVSVELGDAPEADTSAQRVLMWLQTNRELIADAEARHHVDRRAIAGAIAWEALENVRGSLERAAGRFEGPGKVHIREGKVGVAAVSTGTIVAKEVEDAGILPAQTTDERAKLLRTPAGSIEYVAGTMRLGAEIASRHGFDISGDPKVLCFFFNAMDTAKWEARLKAKKPGSDFVVNLPMTEWVSDNAAFLEKAVGPSGLKTAGPVAGPAPEAEPDPAELRKMSAKVAFTLAELVVAADDRGAQSIDITVVRRGANLEPSVQTSDEPRYKRPSNRVGMSMASALAKLQAPMEMLAASGSVTIRFHRVAEGWMEMTVTTSQGPPEAAAAPGPGGTLARAPETDAGTPADASTPAAAAPTITYRSTAEEEGMTPEAIAALTAILTTAGVTSAQVSSVARDSASQAAVMYANLEGTGSGKGVEAQRALYAAPGDKVIDVYEALKKEGKTPAQIKAGMKEKIDGVGPSNVTQHAADASKVCVFDVGPASVPADKHAKLTEAGKAAVGTSLLKFIPYPADPGFHFEVAVPEAAAPDAGAAPAK